MRRIVQEHGGTLAIQPADGGILSITAIFQAHPREVTGMNILVVDDEASQRDMLSGFLRHQGHDVLTAASGQEARAVFQREPVQLVLLDRACPAKAGEELLRHLKEVNPLVRAIMITAFSSVHTAVAVMKLGRR